MVKHIYSSIIPKLGEWLANGIVNDISKSRNPRLKKLIMSVILKFIDPSVSVIIGNKKLKMRLSHKAPYFYSTSPNYDRALPRVCKSIQKVDQYLIIVDIGANIGDTAYLISEKVSGASILCIEGDKNFLPFLYENTSEINNNVITIEPKYCVDEPDNNSFNIVNKNGTAHLSISDHNKVENIDTLDNMLKNNNTFQKANILKIDTDGFEMLVLNGARELLKQTHPVIFFEFTPSAYVVNKQNPLDLINFLFSLGYNKALFYDNFGNPLEIYSFADTSGISNLIGKIDRNKVYYYDVLCIHATDDKKYLNILKSELHYSK